MTDGVVDIRGKKYQTVALRVQQFRRDHPEWAIVTTITEQGEERVTVRAVIMVPSESPYAIASGHAEEYRGASAINRTSAVENCETSAVGRALAFLGYAGDGSLASAEELRPKAPAPEQSPGVVDVRALVRAMGATDAASADRLIREASEGAHGWADIASQTGDVLRQLRDHRDRVEEKLNRETE